MRPFAFCAGPAALLGIVPPVAAAPRLTPTAAWMSAARLALAVRDTPGALRAFEGALVQEPRLALAHLGRAVCLTRMERTDEASDALRATLETADGQEEVLYQLARVCASDGHAAVAIPLLREAVRARPALAEAASKDHLFRDHPAYLAAVGAL